MAKTETLNLRVSADFKRRLSEEAAKEKRSVTNYLEVILTELWDQRESRLQRRAEKPSRK
jgi:predicted HicB family RNase H-like nuclease